MSLPFLNAAPGYDEELRNSVFFERGLHATSIWARPAPRWPWRGCRGRTRQDRLAAGIGASMGVGLLEANRTAGSVKRVHCG
jgi:hypothetical protein